MNQQDTEYVEVLYNHRNKGGHPVYGGVTGTFYGYRAGGEKFLVHKDDAAGQPTLFQIIPAQPTAPKITYQTPKMSPPPPTPIVEPAQMYEKGVRVAGENERVFKLDEELLEKEHLSMEAILSGDLDNIKRPLDLQTLPGVTPEIARRMAAAGLDSKEAILANASKLTKIKGIAETRAKTIVLHLKAQE